jgi:hypothetical protein
MEDSAPKTEVMQSLDWEKILSEEPTIVTKALGDVCVAKLGGVLYIADEFSRGSPTLAAASDFTPDEVCRIETRLSNTEVDLRCRYLLLLSYAGGSEAVDVAKRLLVQILGKDTALTTNELDDVYSAIELLACIGGPEAFATLLELRTHQHEKISRWAKFSAWRLAVLCEPREIEYDDHGDPVYELNEAEKNREIVFKRDYPLEETEVEVKQ